MGFVPACFSLCFNPVFVFSSPCFSFPFFLKQTLMYWVPQFLYLAKDFTIQSNVISPNRARQIGICDPFKKKKTKKNAFREKRFQGNNRERSEAIHKFPASVVILVTCLFMFLHLSSANVTLHLLFSSSRGTQMIVTKWICCPR